MTYNQGKTACFFKPTTQRKARPTLYDLKMAHCVMPLKTEKNRSYGIVMNIPRTFFTAASCSRTAVVPVAPPWKAAKAVWRDESEKLWKSFRNGPNPSQSTDLIALTCLYSVWHKYNDVYIYLYLFHLASSFYICINCRGKLRIATIRPTPLSKGDAK